MNAHNPQRARVVTADASKVSGAEFWRELNADRFAKRERVAAITAEFDSATTVQARADALLKGVAEHLDMPLDELKRRTKGQWQ